MLLGALCGAALWSSLGVLDANGPPAAAVRMAMLPPWWLLAVLVAAGAILVGVGGAWLQRRISGPSPAAAASDALLPLGAASLLLLPYLPWLPDRLPALTALASDLRWLIWALVLSQVARSVWRLNWARPDESVDGRGWRLAKLAVAACALASIVAATRLTGTILYPTGDEPHYLIIAQSLWRDGDLRIENNHARGDFKEYFNRSTLAPDYLARGIDGEIYSVHPVGLPLLLAPVYGAAGYTGVLVVLLGIAAATGGTMIWWMRRLRLAPGAAAWAWLAVGASASFLLHAFAVYPETTAGFCVALALALATTGSGRTGRWGAVGLLAASLPWLSTKYAPMAAAVICIGLGRIWIAAPSTRAARLRSSLALLTPFGIGGLAWLAFFWIYWGTPSPTAPYANSPGMAMGNLLAGVPGLLVDQEFGILLYAPVLALGLLGLGAMARTRGASRRQALEIGATFAALLVTVGAFHMWWGGSSPPGRPLVSGLALLAVPIAWLIQRDHDRPARAAIYHLLLVWSLACTAMLVLSQDGNLVINARGSGSKLLASLSPLWPASALAPSFIVQPPFAALMVVLLWIGLAAIVAGLCRRAVRGSSPAGAASLTVTALAATVIVAGSVVAPRLRGASGRAPSDLEMRPTFDLLNRFDAGRRPVGVVYDPVRLVPVGELIRRFVFRVEPPPLEPDPTGRSLLYGRRLSLPAGRYRVHLTTADGAAVPAGSTLSLQLGRLGPPAVTWPVGPSPDAGSPQFELATDVAYAGFLASPELERAEPHVRLVPVAIVDASDRPPAAQVHSARFYAEGAIFFLDDNVFHEPGGFWIRKDRSASFLISVTAASQPPIRLRTHCGPVANELQITSGQLDEYLMYQPRRGPFDITIPATAGRALVRGTTSSGFVPAERDPGSQDRRDLGCWIAMDGWTPSPSTWPNLHLDE